MKTKTKTKTKIIHEGEYMTEIAIEMTYNDDEWSPYLSLEDAEKLDTIRLAMRDNDLKNVVRSALQCLMNLSKFFIS